MLANPTEKPIDGEGSKGTGRGVLAGYKGDKILK